MTLSVLIWVLIALAILIVIIFIYYFNRFVILENRIDNSLSQIDVQLRKRAELVPNLIETVKGYAKHEKGIMSEVTKARQALVSAKGLQARMKKGAELESVIGRLFAIAENYPDLKANQNFLELQRELAAIEDKIAYARQFYNDAILTFNNSVESFPGNMFASMYGKKEKPFLEIPKEQKVVPKVKFD